ncbi:MAG: hypothetical protein ACQEUZ_01885 [Pseudomonadota bacterium]
MKHHRITPGSAVPDAQRIHEVAQKRRAEKPAEVLIASAMCALAALEPADLRLVVKSLARPGRAHRLDEALDDPLERLAWVWRDATPDERRAFLARVTGRRG